MARDPIIPICSVVEKTPYLTLSQTTEFEIEPIKGSRFIGIATPIDSDMAATQFVAEIKQRFPDARHWCWAYQLREQKRTRFSDDGEPSGSAGKPILAPIVGQQLFDVLVVVVRYFGGVKLGVGGLVRAYSHATNAVLSVAEQVEVVPKIILNLSYSYEDTGKIASALSMLQLQEENIIYTDRVQSTLAVTFDEVDKVCQQLTDYTAGRIMITHPNSV